jgi:cobyrinic acid a,c-diamide synthase
MPGSVASGVSLAVAGGPAFSFTYPDNLEALAAAGAELVPFDPCSDAALPEHCHGLVAGGGFPEVFAEQLAANEPLLADVRRQVGAGLTTWAECGGLLWLCAELDGRPMAGAIAARGRMTDRLSLGYRSAVTTGPTPLGPAGTHVRGHEFHYSATDPAGDLFVLTGRHGTGRAGFGSPFCVASYLHVHLAGRTQLAADFVRSCSALRVPYKG